MNGQKTSKNGKVKNPKQYHKYFRRTSLISISKFNRGTIHNIINAHSVYLSSGQNWNVVIDKENFNLKDSEYINFVTKKISKYAL